MFTLAATNMILRGDGKSNLINEDFLKQDPFKLQLKEANIEKIAFDRNGYKYHGVVAAFADTLRENGIKL